MEFDRSKVFTALNAEELEVGSMVIVADSMMSLKSRVLAGTAPTKLVKINTDAFPARFAADGDWLLAYLVEGPEEKSLKWTDLELLDRVVNVKTGSTAVVTRIDPSAETDYHVAFGPEWMSVSELKDWRRQD